MKDSNGRLLQRSIDGARCLPSWSWAKTQAGLNIRNLLSHHGIGTEKSLYTACITKLPTVTKFAPISQLSNNDSESVSIGVCAWLRACQVVPASPEWGIWSLAPTTEAPGPEVEMYTAAAWRDFGMHQKNRQEIRKFIVTSQNLEFHHDEQPEKGQDLFCVLLTRRFHHRGPYHRSKSDKSDIYSNVIDYGIVCKAVDLSRKLFLRVGSFTETFCWNKLGGRPEWRSNDRQKGQLESLDDSEVEGWYSKAEVLRHLGFHRKRDGTLEQRPSLAVDAQTGVRICGLTLDDIQHQDFSIEETEREQLLYVSEGQLSLFKDRYEEVEIEII